ncbi:MAG: endo-1,4-beta-xylanase [Armatimonadetes bacterium]|nr:endo-1,4-beta-xylanase [Armatimonadota bacterium]
MPRHALVVIALTACLSLSAVPQPALKSLMPPGARIGVALNERQIDGVAAALVTRHFNSISPENVLKWESLHPARGRYAFAAADRYVAFGERHGMEVTGHTLVWHQQVPAWVFTDPRGTRAALKDHVKQVVGRYRGRIRGWDVVNEALDERGALRDSPWRRALGDDYVAEAYTLAHASDPDAELYYADYNLFRPEKRAGALRLIRDLQSRGIRIDGVGIHAHWGLDFPTKDEIRQMLADFDALGISVMLSELDVSVLPRRSDLNPYVQGLPREIQQKLAQRYAEIFRLALENKTTRITLWGLDDGSSWLNDYPVPGRTNHPLLWDRAYRPKPAFDAVVEVLRSFREK